MKKETRKSGRRTRKDVESILGRYEQSAMRVAEFSKPEGISQSTLYRWLRERRKKPPETKLMEMPKTLGVGRGFRLWTPTGYRIELPVCFSNDELKRLLGVLKA